MVATAFVPRVRFVRLRHGDRWRRLAVLDAATRDRYVGLVARSADAIESLLSPAVVANRVSFRRYEPPTLRLRPWRIERRLFAARLAELIGRHDGIVFADVRRCYASIAPSMVGEALRRAEIPTADELESFLSDLELEGVHGLPVGPEPSAVLANLVLGSTDRMLRDAGIEHLRWVDDLVLTTADPQAALSALRRAVERIGLHLNERKTRIVTDAGSLVSRAVVSAAR